MKLSFENIKNAALGAVRIEKGEKGLLFYRFSREQNKFYEGRDIFARSVTATGVKLCFKTDSSSLFIKIFANGEGATRSYFAVDVCKNGELVGSIENYDDELLEKNFPYGEFPMGEFSKKFCIGDGEKEIKIHLPWSQKIQVCEISLGDGSSFMPCVPDKKLLMFGDSITQGYDSLHPSRRYAAIIADMLCMEEKNRAVAGEVFVPQLVDYAEDFKPDLITVAYGTNDWHKLSREEFEQNCSLFFEKLSKKYPDVNIVAISPIWRGNSNEERKFGDFSHLESFISKTVSKYKNITFVSGLSLVEHQPDRFGDGFLHPNEKGFESYAKNLYNQIKNLV